jgi:hypothetical protein
MHHVCKPKRMLTGLLAVVLAGFVVQSAVAFSVGQNDTKLAAASVSSNSSTPKAPLVIPYLSHGVGVDMSRYGGQSSSSTPLVIPYLSHGVGVDMSRYGGQSSSSMPLVIPSMGHTADAEQSFDGGATAQAPDAFDRAVTRHETFVHAMNTAAVKSGPDAFQRAVNRNEATQSTAVRPDDRAGIRGITASDISAQSQSTAVRPDDRSGLRGIGTISGAQSTSTAGTNWNTVFMVGGALLGVLLIVAAGVLLSRRQQGRVLAH